MVATDGLFVIGFVALVAVFLSVTGLALLYIAVFQPDEEVKGTGRTYPLDSDVGAEDQEAIAYPNLIAFALDDSGASENAVFMRLFWGILGVVFAGTGVVVSIVLAGVVVLVA